MFDRKTQNRKRCWRKSEEWVRVSPKNAKQIMETGWQTISPHVMSLYQSLISWEGHFLDDQFLSIGSLFGHLKAEIIPSTFVPMGTYCDRISPIVWDGSHFKRVKYIIDKSFKRMYEFLHDSFEYIIESFRSKYKVVPLLIVFFTLTLFHETMLFSWSLLKHQVVTGSSDIFWNFR